MAAAPAPPKPEAPAPEGRPGAKPGAPGHEEWLIDESVIETFPASDPVSPAAGPGKTKTDPEAPAEREAGGSI